MVVVLLLLMVPVWYRYGPRAVYTHIQAVTKINIKLGTGTYRARSARAWQDSNPGQQSTSS